MPRPPDATGPVVAMPGAVYSSLVGKLADYEGEKYFFHVGDTWAEPALGTRMEDLRVEHHSGLHRYSAVQGLPPLLEAIAARVTARTACRTAPAEVLVGAGATGVLASWIAAFVEPGEEVLVLSPSWPLFAGALRIFRGTAVPISFLGIVWDELARRLRAALTERTVALYFSNPNNPSGQVLPPEWVSALARFAREHNLWLVSDEVYEDFVFARHHVPARPFAPERTFTAYSMSKAFGMAGNRCGYLVGPSAALEEVRKVATHLYYHAPTSAQWAALRALAGPGDAWAAERAVEYRDIARRCAEILGVPAPEGGTFLFVDVSASLDEHGLDGFLQRCVARGLVVAPGTHFGPHPGFVRACFTCTPPDVTLRGMQVLAEVMGG
jgi:aspartate/methionine/tyrosine aminotransferase